MEKIGFQTTASQPTDKDVWREIEMLKRRVESIELNDGNYQTYLKLKDKFEQK